jgi:hypothetical protein
VTLPELRSKAGGTNYPCRAFHAPQPHEEAPRMNAIIYLVGLVVIVMFILSLVGIR